MSIWWYLAGIVVCIFLSNYFSAAEMAYSSCNRLRLENAMEDGSKRAALAVKIVDRYDNALSAILIGNNLVNIACSSLGSLAVMLIIGDGYAWVSTVVITLLVIIFGETIPKIRAKGSANRIALRDSYVIRGLTIVLMPIIWIVVGIINLITGRLKGEQSDDD